MAKFIIREVLVPLSFIYKTYKSKQLCTLYSHRYTDGDGDSDSVSVSISDKETAERKLPVCYPIFFDVEDRKNEIQLHEKHIEIDGRTRIKDENETKSTNGERKKNKKSTHSHRDPTYET